MLGENMFARQRFLEIRECPAKPAEALSRQEEAIKIWHVKAAWYTAVLCCMIFWIKRRRNNASSAHI